MFKEFGMSISIKQPLPKPLRLGFIGGGVNSAVGYAHYVASQLDNKWQVVSGFFSRHSDINRQTAESWHIPEFEQYASWQQYVDQELQHLDAIVVLTPTPQHVEQVCYLLERGVPVICEKALTASVPDSMKIHEVLTHTNGFLAVTFNYSGYSMVRELKARIAQGDLGKIHLVQVEMQSDAFINKASKGKPQEWRLQDGAIPTILLDLAVHLHHLVYFITENYPVSVLAEFNNFSSYKGIVDDAHLLVNYTNDMRASYWVSKAAYGHKNGLKVRVYGELGSAEWFQEHPDQLIIANESSVVTQYNRGTAIHQDKIVERFKPGHPTGFVEAFANLYSDIADNLAKFKLNSSDFKFDETVFGWEHAHEGLELLQTASQSHQQRAWCRLNSNEQSV
jgi:predicted dehydrogenase